MLRVEPGTNGLQLTKARTRGLDLGKEVVTQTMARGHGSVSQHLASNDANRPHCKMPN